MTPLCAHAIGLIRNIACPWEHRLDREFACSMFVPWWRCGGMKSLAWIPFGLLAGFLAGYGVRISLDLLPLLAVSLLVAGYYLIANSNILQD